MPLVPFGVNHIDTAAFYFSPLRSANELIGTTLAPYPHGLVIATKVGPGRDAQGAWQGMARPDQLRGQVDENLRQLGRDHLDLVNLRTLPVSKPVGEHGGKRDGELEPVLAVARAHGATPAQVRLAWTLAQGNHVLAIPGTSSLAHLGENVAAGQLRLTEEELVLLGALT